MKSCFRHFFCSDIDAIFSLQLVHNLFTRKIVVEGTRQYEIWFGICRRQMRFSKKEFCLVTRLKFGGSSTTDTNVAVLVRNVIHERYEPMMDVEVIALHKKFIDVDFQ